VEHEEEKNHHLVHRIQNEKQGTAEKKLDEMTRWSQTMEKKRRLEFDIENRPTGGEVRNASGFAAFVGSFNTFCVLLFD
jgi:hypothetical protein